MPSVPFMKGSVQLPGQVRTKIQSWAPFAKPPICLRSYSYTRAGSLLMCTKVPYRSVTVLIPAVRQEWKFSQQWWTRGKFECGKVSGTDCYCIEEQGYCSCNSKDSEGFPFCGFLPVLNNFMRNNITSRAQRHRWECQEWGGEAVKFHRRPVHKERQRGSRIWPWEQCLWPLWPRRAGSIHLFTGESPDED